MKSPRFQPFRFAVEAGKAALVASLCMAMAAPDAWAAEGLTAAPVDSPSAVKPATLTQQQKVLQALNRFTFGPRPGDELTVTKAGLDAWFEQQLHPDRIDDSALDARLDQFPALKLSQEDLIRRFPSPQMIRQMSRRDVAPPSDPVQHAVYADALAAYTAQQKKAAADPNPAQTQGAGQLQSDGTMSGDMSSADMQQAPASMSADGQTAAPVVKAKGKKKLDVPAMSPDDVSAVIMLPPDQRVQRLLAMSPEEMLSFRAGLRPFQRLMLARGLSPAQTELVGAMEAPVRVVGAEAMESRLLRDLYSERQLQAVMTDFWLNHFSVYIRKNQNEPYFLASYERDTVLPNALGKFEDLLVATAKSPAMLMYLDNWQSIGPDSRAAQRVKRLGDIAPNSKLLKAAPKGLNENYARELMELHTLGVNGGYTQKDVIEVAKCFTGWTIDRPYQGGGYAFEPNRHEGGSKTVLGKTISESGENEGLTVLHILATSPATAHFISNKLAVRFVSDTPPPALVDRMAATFLKTDGDIKAVLSTMFHSPEFWSPQVYRAKLKTPLEFMTSAVRASNANVQNAVPLVQAMQQLGMPIYGMQTPNGYSWMADGWASSNALVSRMNFSVVLSANRLPGVRTDWTRLTGSPEDASSVNPATEHKLEMLVLGQPAAARTRETVLAQATNPSVQQDAEKNFALRPTADDESADQTGVMLKRVNAKRPGGDFLRSDLPETPLDTMAGLLLGSPDFQRR